MAIRLHGKRVSINEADLAAFEKSLPAPLPEDYRKFLLGHNGGAPRPNTARSRHGARGHEWIIDCFLALGGIGPFPELRDLERRRRMMQASGLPPDWLPVADTVNEHTLLLSLPAHDRGKIYALFDHPDPPELHVTEGRLAFDSFSELWESLEQLDQTQSVNPVFE